MDQWDRCPPGRKRASEASGERMRAIRFFLFQSFLFCSYGIEKRKAWVRPDSPIR
jgi:hypothetical protein